MLYRDRGVNQIYHDYDWDQLFFLIYHNENILETVYNNLNQETENQDANNFLEEFKEEKNKYNLYVCSNFQKIKDIFQNNKINFLFLELTENEFIKNISDLLKNEYYKKLNIIQDYIDESIKKQRIAEFQYLFIKTYIYVIKDFIILNNKTNTTNVLFNILNKKILEIEQKDNNALEVINNGLEEIKKKKIEEDENKKEQQYLNTKLIKLEANKILLNDRISKLEKNSVIQKYYKIVGDNPESQLTIKDLEYNEYLKYKDEIELYETTKNNLKIININISDNLTELNILNDKSIKSETMVNFNDKVQHYLKIIKKYYNDIIKPFINHCNTNVKIESKLEISNVENELLHYKLYFKYPINKFIYFFMVFKKKFDDYLINHYSNVQVFININPYTSINKEKGVHQSEKFMGPRLVINKEMNRISYEFYDFKILKNRSKYTYDIHPIKSELSSYYNHIFDNLKNSNKLIKENTEIKEEFARVFIENNLFKMLNDNCNYIYCASGYSGSGKTFNLKILLESLVSVYDSIDEFSNFEFQFFELYGEIDSNTNKMDINIYNPGEKINLVKSIQEIKTIKFSSLNKLNSYIDQIVELRKTNTSLEKYNARIRQTPNNEESSRSHLIINVKYKNTDNNIEFNFKILDMGGSEDVNNIEKQYYEKYINSKFYNWKHDKSNKQLIRPILKIYYNPTIFYNIFMENYKNVLNTINKKEIVDIDNVLSKDVCKYENIKNNIKNLDNVNFLNIVDSITASFNIQQKKNSEDEFIFFNKEAWIKHFNNYKVQQDIENNSEKDDLLKKLSKIITQENLIKYLVNFKTPFIFILYKVLKLINNNEHFSVKDEKKELERKKVTENKKKIYLKIKYKSLITNRLLHETFGYIYHILQYDKDGEEQLLKINNNIINFNENKDFSESLKFLFNRITYSFVNDEVYYIKLPQQVSIKIDENNIYENYFDYLSKNNKESVDYKTLFDSLVKNGNEYRILFDIINNDIDDKINFDCFQNFLVEIKNYYITPLINQGNFINKSIEIFKDICKVKNLNDEIKAKTYFENEKNYNNELQDNIKTKMLECLNINNNNDISSLKTKIVILCCIKYYSEDYINNFNKRYETDEAQEALMIDSNSRAIIARNYLTDLNKLYIEPIKKTLEFADSLIKIEDITSNNKKGEIAPITGGLMNNKFSIFQTEFTLKLIIFYYTFISGNNSIIPSVLFINIVKLHSVFKDNENENEKKYELSKLNELLLDIINNCSCYYIDNKKLNQVNEDIKKNYIIFYYISTMALMCIDLNFIEQVIFDKIKNKEDNKDEIILNNYLELLKLYNNFIHDTDNKTSFINDFHNCANYFEQLIQNTVNKKIQLCSEGSKDMEGIIKDTVQSSVPVRKHNILQLKVSKKSYEESLKESLKEILYFKKIKEFNSKLVKNLNSNDPNTKTKTIKELESDLKELNNFNKTFNRTFFKKQNRIVSLQKSKESKSARELKAVIERNKKEKKLFETGIQNPKVNFRKRIKPPPSEESSPSEKDTSNILGPTEMLPYRIPRS
jgi:hypothetical protein